MLSDFKRISLEFKALTYSCRLNNIRNQALSFFGQKSSMLTAHGNIIWE